MSKLLKTIAKLACHVVWPQFCPACGRIGVSFCGACLAESLAPLPVFCLECGGKYGVPCCVDSVPCYAASPHLGLARDFMISFKYRNARAMGLHMGKLIAEAAGKTNAADIVIPVPLHRLSKREFNQSYIIARGFSSAAGIADGGDVLMWRSGAARQMGKSAHERRSVPRGAIKSTVDLSGKRIALVDDVYTTGATLRATRHAVESAGGVVTAVFVWSRRIK